MDQDTQFHDLKPRVVFGVLKGFSVGGTDRNYISGDINDVGSIDLSCICFHEA